MDSVWLNVFSVLFVFSMAIISPGPNFVLVLNTALNRSRREVMYTALGVAIGSTLFAVAGLFGLILILDSSPIFALLVRSLGSGYLVYLGLTMLIRRRARSRSISRSKTVRYAQHSALSLFMRGLLTNMTNPKAWAFYLSLFSLVGRPDFPFWAKLLLCGLVFLVAMFWYGAIAMLLSDRRIQKGFYSFQSVINIFLGLILVVLGVKMWSSS